MKPYSPHKLPLTGLDYERLIALVGDANAELARYDGLLQGIVNPQVMLAPLVREESVLSSRIEGTQATVNEVLEQEAGILKEGEKYEDIQEIMNYHKALHSAHSHLGLGVYSDPRSETRSDKRPITLSLVLQLHKILLNSVRGKDKTPGAFRKDQNWIGAYGCTMEEASFIPPNPLQLHDHLEAWQTYTRIDDTDLLVQSAVVHAQFELIHPFTDGNGRIGRILIPLFLYQKKKLSQPMFYLSAYLEANREEYYARLRNISDADDWNGWIEFFLTAIIEQAKINNRKVKAMMALYERMKQEIQTITHSQYTIDVLDAIFDRPTFETAEFIRRTNIHKSTALGLLRQLKNRDILQELQPASGRRAAVLWFPELLDITK